MDWVSILIISGASLIGLVIILLFMKSIFGTNKPNKVKITKDGVEFSSEEDSSVTELPEVTDPSKDFVEMDHQSYMYSVLIVRKVERERTLLLEKVMYKQQMDYVERQLKEFVDLIDTHFDEWLDVEGYKGDQYFNLRQENQRFLEVVYDFLRLRMRTAVFRNGYSEYTDVMFEEYVESTTKEYLNEIGRKRRNSTVHPKEMEAYLRYADRNFLTYKSMIHDMFNHTKLIHLTIKGKVACLEKFIADHKDAFRRGIILEYEEPCVSQ